MTNRIGPVDPTTINKAGNKIEDTGTKSKVADSAANRLAGSNERGASADTVELTENAKLLQRMVQTVGTSPAIDSQRVEAVKTAIQNGEYQVDVEAIADSMIRIDRLFGDQ
ncbi:MAG: flagellar biosynthesis anti-sigma factor FlgM [Pseudomonadota bacterium]